jgi:hypothetical protein
MKHLFIFISVVIVLFSSNILRGEVSEETEAEWNARQQIHKTMVEKWEAANRKGICEVHQTKMPLRNVQIIYGLPAGSENDPTYEVRFKLFPHAREISFGGCVVMPDSPKTEMLRICPTCKQAEQAWKDSHKRKD